MLLKKSKNVRLDLSLFILLIPGMLSAQDNTLLWYFSTEDKSEVPAIEGILKDLKKRQSDQLFFSSAVYLNSLDSDRREREVRRLMDRFVQRGTFFMDNSSPVNDSLAQKLINFNYLLKVELQSREREKEFIFSLYKAIPGRQIGADSIELAGIDLESYRGENAIVRNNTSIEQVSTQLEDAIKSFFPTLNQPPVAHARINEEDTKTYFVNRGETITLNALYSDDGDTPRKNLKYRWRQIALDGSVNVPIRKMILLKETEAVGTYVLPDTGVYKIGLTVHDGIANSKEDTLTIINFNQPKILLSKKSLHKRKKVSLFQFMARKNRSTKLDETIRVSVDSEIPLEYELIYFERKNKGIPVRIDAAYIASRMYELRLSEQLKHGQAYELGMFGRAGNVHTDTSFYQLKHPDLSFFRLSIGVEYFLGVSILCVKPLNSDIWWLSPMTVQGGVYLFHVDGASLLLESGAIIFLRKKIADRIAGGFVLGKVSLKLIADAKNYSSYLAFHVIGGPARNGAGELIHRRHWGGGLGIAVRDRSVEVDIINVYYNTDDQCLSISGGLRFNIHDFRLFNFDK